MTNHSFDAVIFDLDGVITQTALVHSSAWKEMFDTFLRHREKEHGEPFREFTHQGDYLPYVDGKPRYKGVASFLESRAIDIPFGDPSDDPEAETVCGLGNRKNKVFNEILKRDGVKLYDSTVDLIHELIEAGIRIGVASSSKNCKPVLESAGLLDLFETRVDGIVSAEMGLKGKPEPDIFTTACDNLGVAYSDAVVVEDAVSGVQAGRKGNFGLTLGVAREENTRELLINGADIVVTDIAELGGIEGLERWFREGLEADNWSITYHDYIAEKEKSREALLAVGNGYFGTRGAMEECTAGERNYPGTYMVGMFNRRTSMVADRPIENEDFVNCINWLPVSFSIEQGEWMDPNQLEILEIRRNLNFRNGLLLREMIVQDGEGHKTRIISRRIASMDDPHAAGMQYEISPLNYGGQISLKSALDGSHINDGVARYRQLDQLHLEAMEEAGRDDQQHLLVCTNQSGVEIGAAARLDLSLDGAGKEVEWDHVTTPGRVESMTSVSIDANQILRLEKRIQLHTSREAGQGKALTTAEQLLGKMKAFDALLDQSAGAWADIWEKADIRVTGDRFAQKMLRMHIYHLLVTVSPHHVHYDAGIPARGLHGEAYRGHYFWDELYILNFYAFHFPEVAKSVLLYRFRRIGEARKYAAEHGYQGAMYPWQSGSDGREETQVVHLNPVSGEWGPDYSSLQRHVSLAIAFNIWYYYWISLDREFIVKEGGEMLLEICRFWASKCEPDEGGRYSIREVMGPDEFHEHLPGSSGVGLTNNAYTNLMVAWLFDKVTGLLGTDELDFDPLIQKIALKPEEVDFWHLMCRKLTLGISEEGIIEQYRGYFGLKELDWEAYRAKYENIHRMDRILKAEGKSPDDYKVAKQADTLMAWFNMDDDEIEVILERMGYAYRKEMLKRNFDYYIQRTSHGSTLSRIVHAYLASQLDDQETAWRMYMEALSSDYVDIQGGTTGEGIHAGVMGSTLLYVMQSIAGIHFRHRILRVEPHLPPGWKNVHFSFAFQKNYYIFTVMPEKLEILLKNEENQSVTIKVKGMEYELVPGRKLEVSY